MSAETVPVTVRILDREYQIACRADEREALLAAAEHVHERMLEARGRGNVIGTDRVAVMTALNMAHELLALRRSEQACARACERIDAIDQRVSAALAEGRTG